MTRESLTRFIHAVEHSSSLRRELSKCKDLQKVLEVANNYGFRVSNQDLKEDALASKVEKSFEINKLSM